MYKKTESTMNLVLSSQAREVRGKKKLVSSWSNCERGIKARDKTKPGKKTLFSPVLPTQLTEPLNLVGRGQPDPSVHNPAASTMSWTPSKVKLAEDYSTLLMLMRYPNDTQNKQRTKLQNTVGKWFCNLKAISSFLTWILSSLNIPSIRKYVQNTGHSHSIFSKSLSSAGS